jgi:ABC-2 type transport system permease protein
VNVATATAGRLAMIESEAAKLPAFARRNFLEAWSYRMAFFFDVGGLGFQAVTFFYVGKLVAPDALPEFGGARVSYLEFAAVGIAITMFVGLALVRAASAFRQEQLTGTLEMLLMTPTTPMTIQLGLVFYDLIYMPVRTAVFFLIIVVVFDVHLAASGLLPAIVTLLAFIPFVWGLGIVLSAATVTFKQAGAAILGSLLALTSGAFFPVTLFPGWLASVAEHNPMTVAITTMRETLLGDAGWPEVGGALVVLVPAAAISLALGIVSFRLAVRRERRRGTVGLY